MVEEQAQQTRKEAGGGGADDGSAQRLLAMYEAELKLEPDGAPRTRLLLAAGRVLDERLGRRSEAIRHYEQALALDPGFQPARRALKRLYRSLGQLEQVADVLAAEAEAAPTPLKRAQACWERGQTLEALGNEAGARAAYQAALAAAPAFLPALFALEPLLLRAGEYTALAGWLEQVIPCCTEPADQAVLLTALGRLREGQLDDAEGAFDAYTQAVELFPQEVEALAALERLCRRLQRWSDLARVLEKEAALSEAGPSGASTLLEVARIRSDLLGDQAGARAALEEAAALDPLHRPTLDALAALLNGPADRPRLAEVLGRCARLEPEPLARADLLTRQAALLLELGEEDEAVAALEQALQAYPQHRPALQALGEHHRRRGNARGLAQMQLAEARSQADVELRARGLLRAAELYERQLGDSETALQVLQEALQTGPGRLAAVRELSRLLGKLGRWAELARVLEGEAERATDPEQALLHLLELARVQDERLDDPAAAVRSLEAILVLHPGHRTALERLMQLHRRLERWEALIRTLLTLAEHLKDSRSVVAALTDAGRVAEEGLGDPERGAELYRRALTLNPGYVPALQALGRLLSAAGRWAELVAMHEQSLQAAGSDEERADLHGRIALLQWRRLDDPERASASLRQALACRPGDPGALKTLEAIALERGRREELAEVLRLQADAAGEPAARALLLARQGAVLEGLPGGEQAALAAYAASLQADPGFLPAYRSLVRLHGAAGRWPEVAEVIAAMLEVEQDPAQRVLLLMRLATVQREQLGDLDAAREAYQRVLALDPGHPSVLRAMEAALRREGDPARLVPVLEARAHSLDDPLLVGAYLLEIDRLGPLGNRAGKSPEALLVAAMKQEPWSLSGLERLEGLAVPRREPESLVDFYGRALECIEDEQTRRDLELRQAELLEQAGRLEEAQRLYRELLARVPDDLPALEGLQRVLGALGDRVGLLSAIEQKGRVVHDGERVVPDLLAAGDEWRALGEPERAERLYELALRRHPDGLEALLRLEALLQERGEEDRLAELLASLLPRAAAEQVRLEIHLRLAARAEREGDLIAARGHLAAALTAVPGDLRAHHALARVLQELGADEEAAREWEVVAGHPQATQAQLRAARLALGELWGLSLGQAGRAIAVLDTLLAEDPQDADALAVLQDVLAADCRWGRLEEVIERRLALASPAEQVELYLEWARIEEEERGDRVSAYGLLQEARRIDPAAAEPVRQLGRILWEDRAYDTLRALFMGYADGLGSKDAGRAVPFLTQLGHLYMESFATTADAVVLLERVLAIDPSLLEVRRDLAVLYARQSETLHKAVEQHQHILELEPLQLASLEALFGLFERLRAHDRAFSVGGVLEYLGALAPEDRAGMDEYRTRALREARRELSAAERDSLMPYPEEGDPLSRWIELMQRSLPKVFPDDLKERGVAKSMRATSRAQDPVLNQCLRLASSLGAGSFHLYRVPRAEFDLELAATDPPSILLSETALDGWSLAQRRFHLARAVASLRKGLHILPVLGEELFEALLVASARLEDEDLEVEGVDEAALAECSSALSKKLAPRLQRPLAELARLVIGSGMPLRQQVRRAACSMQRAGLLFAGDVAVVLGELVGPPLPEEDVAARLARLQQSPAALDLVSWLLSDRYAEMRRGVGIAVD